MLSPSFFDFSERSLVTDRHRPAPQIIDVRAPRGLRRGARHLFPAAAWRDTPRPREWSAELDRDAAGRGRLQGRRMR